MFQALLPYLPTYLEALLLTLKLAALGVSLAVGMGYLLAVSIYYGLPILSTLAKGIVAVARNTPLAIQLFFLYYGLPKIGVAFSEWQCAVLGLAFLGSGYMTQGILSGFNGVAKHQLISARSLGLSEFHIHFHVLLPQSFVFAMPHLVANTLFLTKETSVVSAIAVSELLFVTKDVIGMYYDTAEALTLLVGSYLVILLPLTALLHFLERRVRHVVFGL